MFRWQGTTQRLVGALLVSAFAVGCGGDEKEAKEPARTDAGQSTAEKERATSPPTSDEPRTNRAAGEAKKRQTLYGLRDQNGRAYDELHPAHQKLSGRSAFDACWSKDEQRVQVADPVVTVEEVYDDPLDALLIPEKRSKAVTLKVGERNTVGEGPPVIPVSTDTSHEVYVDGRWRWILNDDTARAFRRGVCPADGEPIK